MAHVTVDNDHVSIETSHGHRRYAVSAIWRTEKSVWKRTKLPDKSKKRRTIKKAVISFVVMIGGVVVSGSGDPQLQAEAKTIASVAALLGFLFFAWFVGDLIRNEKYKTRSVRFFRAQFFCQHDQYNFLSVDERQVDEFLKALHEAQRKAISKVYNISIDNSMNAKDIKIETMHSQSTMFIEGQLDKEEKGDGQD